MKCQVSGEETEDNSIEIDSCDCFEDLIAELPPETDLSFRVKTCPNYNECMYGHCIGNQKKMIKFVAVLSAVNE